MGYGDYQRHLLDQDPPIYDATPVELDDPLASRVPLQPPNDSYQPIPYPSLKVFPPSAPLQPAYSLQPVHGPWVVRSNFQPNMAVPTCMAPHQRRLAAAMARDHGRDFKVQLKALHASAAPNVRTVCDMLQRARSIPQRLGFGNSTVGVLLRVTPNRIAITPDGFFNVARPPDGKTPGQLAPLCSVDFVSLGTPDDFMQQVHAELNGLIRERTQLWRELLLLTKPRKNLHTCRTMQH
jgi:hypothetical protein